MLEVRHLRNAYYGTVANLHCQTDQADAGIPLGHAHRGGTDKGGGMLWL